MLEAMKRSLRKIAYMAILRCRVGEGAVAKRILRETVLSVRAVFEGWVVYGFRFWMRGRGLIVKRV
jgi:hypothetical protein